MIMRFIPYSLNVLLILSYIGMTPATENGTASTSESSVEMVVPASDRSMNITKTVIVLNTSDSVVDKHLYVTENPVSDLTESGNLLNITSEFDNSTDETDTEIDDIHSSFNLAIIPAVAVFVFIVITCFKCCKWFRHYTRGGNKDENFYAVIVTDDDKEYGQIDITSDSTSMACYDTVSSYASFLKRSGNDSTLNSIRTWRQGSFKNDINSSPSRSMKKNVSVDSDIKRVTSYSNTKTKIDETTGDFDVRISSTSSSDTVSEPLTDSPAIKRNNRFRVSFVTETKPSASENRIPNGNVRHEKLMRSSLKKYATTTSPEMTSPLTSQTRTTEEVKMVDVGTQTNKSFRYSLRKRKGHVSDTDLDERLISRLSVGNLTLQVEKCQQSENHLSEKRDQSEAKTRTKHSSISSEEARKKSHSTLTSEFSKYPFDTNVEVIHNCKRTKEIDEDLDDDVFTEEIVTEFTPLSDKSKQLDLNESSERCNSIKKTSDTNLLVGLTQPSTCSVCKTKICRNIVEPFCGEDALQILDDSPVIQTLCEKCKVVYEHKQNVPCDLENDKTEELLIQNQCRFTDMDNRPSSTFSLESSGYAELSSCGSTSS